MSPPVPERMRAVLLEAPGRVVPVTVPVPALGPGDALVAVEASGICGSDLHALHGHHPFRRPPLVLGHEFVGRVVGYGAPAAGRPAPGTRVTARPLATCGRCDRCTAGRSNLCRAKRYPAMPDWPGTLAEYFRVPAATLCPVADAVPAAAAVLAEPMAVAVHAVRRLGPPGARLVVLGGGSIGLLVAVAARSLGWARVAVTDVQEHKTALARALGADGVPAADLPDVTDRLGGPADGVVVTATYPRMLADALAVADAGAPVVLVALTGQDRPLPVDALVLGEHPLLGSVLYEDHDVATAVAIITARPRPLCRLVTHTVPFERAAEAFEILGSGAGRPVKVVLTPQEVAW